MAMLIVCASGAVMLQQALRHTKASAVKLPHAVHHAVHMFITSPQFKSSLNTRALASGRYSVAAHRKARAGAVSKNRWYGPPQGTPAVTLTSLHACI